MKKSLAVFFFVLFGATACSQYTCPTYAQNDVQKSDTEQVVEGKENI